MVGDDALLEIVHAPVAAPAADTAAQATTPAADVVTAASTAPRALARTGATTAPMALTGVTAMLLGLVACCAGQRRACGQPVDRLRGPTAS